MFRKRLIPVVAVAALALATFLGVTGYRAVYAQATTPTPTAPAQSGQSSGTPNQNGAQALPGRGLRGGPGDAVNNTDLAAALNITTDQLTAAYQAANTEALKQAVAKGLITQAQADQMAANAQNSGRPFHFGEFAASGIDYNALLAAALNITPDQLKAAQTTAFNTAIDAAVKAGTMTQAQADLAKGQRALSANSAFQASLKTAYEAAVKQAVSDGVITQAQADAILSAAAQQPNGFFGFGFGLGRGMGHGGRGGHGGPGDFGVPPAGTSTNNSTGTSSGL